MFSRKCSATCWDNFLHHIIIKFYSEYYIVIDSKLPLNHSSCSMVIVIQIPKIHSNPTVYRLIIALSSIYCKCLKSISKIDLIGSLKKKMIFYETYILIFSRYKHRRVSIYSNRTYISIFLKQRIYLCCLCKYQRFLRFSLYITHIVRTMYTNLVSFLSTLLYYFLFLVSFSQDWSIECGTIQLFKLYFVQCFSLQFLPSILVT